MHFARTLFIGITLGHMLLSPAQAEVYATQDAFVTEAFKASPPPPKILWLTGNLAEQAKAVLGHNAPALQLQYWAQDTHSAWVLHEIGKTEPITVGILVQDDKIAALKVLEYRESRGGEVRHPFFTNQFIGLSLADDNRLSAPVDGISGATLSVRALDRMARFALLLHRQISKSQNPP